MTAPDYFLADLPPEAELTPGMITDACHTLRRNRGKYLAGRSTPALIEFIAGLAAEWRRPDFPFRRLAIEQGPAKTGFGAATIAAGLDAYFVEFTRENLEALVVQDLGHAERLDRFVASDTEAFSRRRAMAFGPRLLAHISAGNLPNPSLMALILGLLVRSAQFFKCASGSAFLPRLFAHSLYQAEPKLGACLELAEWRGGRADLEAALFAEADCITVTGSDEAVTAIRRNVPAHARFLGYGHRLSFGYVAREMLSRHSAGKIALQAAADVASWNQLGCLSPHLFYVERGGAMTSEQFAELLALELSALEAVQPRGPLSVAEAAEIASRRALYEARAAASPETRLWQSPGSTAWTVVHETEPAFQVSCLNRFVFVKPVADLDEALRMAETVRGKIATVALAAPDTRIEEFTARLVRCDVPRLCPIGRMQLPSLLWRHDARPSLGDLVHWTDWER